MKKLILTTVLLGLTVFVLPVPADQQPWTLGERSVPVPAGASPALQESIRQTPQPGPDSPFESAKTADGWKAMAEEFDTAWAAGIPDMIEQFGIAVERDEINGVNVYRVSPPQLDPANKDRLFIYAHGGAYLLGAGEAGIVEALLIALHLGIPVLSVDYRMPPDHPFPAAVDDMVTVYQALLKTRPARSMAIGGTSAGGGLSLAAMHKFKALGLPAPGAIYGGTVWSDLTQTGDTLYTNEGLDRMLVTYRGFLSNCAKLYAAGHDLKDPLISPVYGDFTGFPPTILVSGTRDMLLSDVSRTHRKMRAAGVTADLHVYEGMSHAGYMIFTETPESKDMYRELKEFVAKHLD
jgi:monoterpene epsilon-lactone hydrolase